MSEILLITDKLKQLLKVKKKTYSDVGLLLQLSESSVKRMFSDSSFSLERLEIICHYLGMEISDLILLVDKQQKRKDQISIALEKELVSDIRLVLVTNCILNHWKFIDIQRIFIFSEHELIMMMAKLERMGLLQLLPSNKIKLLVSSNFKWHKGGPIETFFKLQVQEKFFESNFDKPGENRLVNNGMLSKSSHAYISEKMHKLSEEFERLCQDDGKLPLEQRYGISMLQAIRPWEPDIFSKFRREKNLKQF